MRMKAAIGIFAFLSAFLCLNALIAQQATPTAQPQTSPLIPPAAQPLQIPADQPSQNPDFRTQVRIVMAPVTVTDRNGNIIEGLQPQDFRLYDNGKLQRITEDMTSHPLSLVVAVQANDQVEKILPQIQKIGSLLQSQVIGDDGEVAVVAFDHRVQTLTGFTSDPDKITAALKKMKPGSWSSRLNDATMESINLLKSRPATRRRVLLLIAEAGDKGSQVRPREVMSAAEFANVVIYSVDISKLMASLTATPITPATDNRPPGAVHLARGEVSTPTTETQMQLGDWTPLIKDIFIEAKGLIIKNPLQVFTAYSGGRQYSFMNQRALDHAVSDIGAELHSQYLLTYSPNNQETPGFHNIVVQVTKPDLKIRTRDGYYLAGTPEGAKK
jgi:VWFA-related protein